MKKKEEKYRKRNKKKKEKLRKKKALDFKDRNKVDAFSLLSNWSASEQKMCEDKGTKLTGVCEFTDPLFHMIKISKIWKAATVH